METTIGGNRLGSGNKQQISYKNYERSTHDLSYLWRSSMSAGTLVPFLDKVALPGDNFEIDLNAEVMTLPTVGPLFGSYKVQLDVFEIPMRLYNAKLHMNKLGVGMDMSQIYLPQIELVTNNDASYVQTFEDNEQVNASSLMKYLGVSGLGKIDGATNPARRKFNACSLLAYWDIYKNYYSNKQEEVGYIIHTSDTTLNAETTPLSAIMYNDEGEVDGDVLANSVQIDLGDYCIIKYDTGVNEVEAKNIAVTVDLVATTLNTVFQTTWWNAQTNELVCRDPAGDTYGKDLVVNNVPTIVERFSAFGIEDFPLANIDTMRELILRYADAGAFVIKREGATAVRPYNCFMDSVGENDERRYSICYSQEGLGLKTYQSDLFNNWINTEWIDGAGGISELTAVDTTGDSFTIDALNIAQKVYAMLNRIAISGGTYDDWLDAVYTHERVKSVESPVYLGSLIKELAFEEVISNAQTTDQPLGTLAGRGRLTGKNKGGKINVTVNEPSVIMGIVSLTPRIEYSQGNEWHVNLKTYDDFHKPALDGIGYQDLITEQLLWSDSVLNSVDSSLTRNSLGKQPAWINYMTAVNKVYGGFAEENNSMFMTLNRRYEKNSDGTIKDATTYIDPTKYNQIFAQTELDSQNFWVQISANITARRKMSAKIIPNL